jgi:hypothetical protein
VQERWDIPTRSHLPEDLQSSEQRSLRSKTFEEINSSRRRELRDVFSYTEPEIFAWQYAGDDLRHRRRPARRWNAHHFA